MFLHPPVFNTMPIGILVVARPVEINLVQNTICKVFFKNNIFIVIMFSCKCSHAPPPPVFHTASIGILVAARLDGDLME